MLGLPVGLAAERFALVVFLSDGLLVFKENPGVFAYTKRATRFMRIMGRLPMELQMLMCHLVVGSDGITIPCTEADAALRALAKVYTPKDIRFVLRRMSSAMKLGTST